MFENHLILKRNSEFSGNEAYCGKTKMVLTTPLEEKPGGEEEDGIRDPQKIKKTTLFAKSFTSLWKYLKLHTENVSTHMKTMTQVLHFIKQIQQETTQFPRNNIPTKT